MSSSERKPSPAAWSIGHRSLLILLVVAMLVVCGGGLLAPAMLKVREAASRMQCTNNLKQIGMAVDNYQNSSRRFPPGTHLNPNLPPEKRFSWLVNIVPFVQSDPLYRRLELEKSWDAEENRFAALENWRIFQCPTFSETAVSTLVPAHYIGLAGVGGDAATLAVKDPRAGFFGYDRVIKEEDLGGRASNILLAVETTRVSEAWTAGGPPTVRGLERDVAYLGRGGQFGGLHSGGVNVLFADGSVKFLPSTIAPEAFEAMATLRGKALPEPEVGH